MKVAIVCDWLTGVGGAERVIVEVHKLYPEAPIYTSQVNRRRLGDLAGADIRSGWLQVLPQTLRKFIPFLRAWYFSGLKLSNYDLVISIGGAEAKFVKTKASQIHLNYCHSPTHYYWRRYDEYLARPGFGWLDPLARLGLKLLVGPLRRWDFKAAQRPDYFIANSEHIKKDIKKYYGRDATVIHPPVDVERFVNKQSITRAGLVTAGRQTPYKRIDLAVAACSALNLPLTVIGDGPEHAKLKTMAGSTIKFLGLLPDAEIPKHFQTAEGFIFPSNVEDFGVTGVEAMAAGTPVIAYNQGGPLDYIIPEKTGLFFEKQTVDSLIKALKKFQKLDFDHSYIASKAQAFSAANFRHKFADFIQSLKLAD